MSFLSSGFPIVSFVVFVLLLILGQFAAAAAVAVYVAVGFFVSWRTCPSSWAVLLQGRGLFDPDGEQRDRALLVQNAYVIWALWPWPIAAHLVRLVTGRYPSWTPPL